MAKVIKIGIIGCGGIANGKHMPALAKVEDAFPNAQRRRQRNSARRTQRFTPTTKSF